MTNPIRRPTIAAGVARTAPAALALALAVAASGCFWVTTKHEGKKLRADVNSIDQRLEVKEESLDQKVAHLQRVIDEATNLLKRNSADLGADVQTMQDEIRKVHGLLTAAKRYADEVREAVVALEARMNERAEFFDQRLTVIEERLAAPPPRSAAELWSAGKAAYDAGDFSSAEAAFRQLVVQHPGHERAANAQFLRGEGFFKQKDHDSAIREYQKVWDRYERDALAPQALFRAGEAAQILRRCTEARAYFGLLRQRFPKSPLFKQSQQKDAELRRNAKNKARCQS
jgi:tol-pal system protein YbgF